MLFPILETKIKAIENVERVKGTNNTEIYEILIRRADKYLDISRIK